MPLLTRLQKAAVLLAALDRQSADWLVDQLPAESADQLRQAVLDLNDADERQEADVIAEFLECTLPDGRPGAMAGHSDGRSSANDPSQAGGFRSQAPAVLPAEELLEGLTDEQPQLIAATLAGASPSQAAEILDRMPVELQAEVLRRMACLDRLPSKWPASLWEELQRRQQVQRGVPVRFAKESLTTVRRILDAHGSHERAALLDYLTRTEPRLAERLADLAGGQSPPVAARGGRGVAG